ncbi:hypothetical protein LIER_18607 [Lithospermum erythrorhizon]|uniref:Reverse transcriptase domain-containing protein n=1 Tax=Lithospermum erythrorhizon TaxID=34254 RepID=A0AAV3QFL1_LITER
MPHFKSPRPDGFPTEFFQKHWNIVGESLTNAAFSFLNNGHILKEINNTFISLIPKIPSPKSVNDFRPISFCNTTYKVASKVLVNRLKPHLNSLLSPFQNGFIFGRGAQDNILMAQELSHSISQSKGKRNGMPAIKIDMSKTLDRVNWNFLFCDLSKLDFSSHWIHLIKECVTSVQYFVLINSQVTDPFKPSCGLRQGDPLSPILFAICLVALSSLLFFPPIKEKPERHLHHQKWP